MIKQSAIALAFCVACPAFGAVNLLSSSNDFDLNIQFEGAGRLQGSESLALEQSELGLSEIAPGTRIESYLIQISDFDSCSLHPYEAVFGFDAPVLGIQTDVDSLKDGFSTLSDSGFDAARPGGGIESNDHVTLHGDLVINGIVGRGGIDPIRVFVEATAVPEFASLGVWGMLSVAGVLSTTRRRR